MQWYTCKVQHLGRMFPKTHMQCVKGGLWKVHWHQTVSAVPQERGSWSGISTTVGSPISSFFNYMLLPHPLHSTRCLHLQPCNSSPSPHLFDLWWGKYMARQILRQDASCGCFEPFLSRLWICFCLGALLTHKWAASQPNYWISQFASHCHYSRLVWSVILNIIPYSTADKVTLKKPVLISTWKEQR